ARVMKDKRELGIPPMTAAEGPEFPADGTRKTPLTSDATPETPQQSSEESRGAVATLGPPPPGRPEEARPPARAGHMGSVRGGVRWSSSARSPVLLIRIV